MSSLRTRCCRRASIFEVALGVHANGSYIEGAAVVTADAPE